jgi:hypothetical protein
LADRLAGWSLMGRLMHNHGNNCPLQTAEGQPCALGELPREISMRGYEDADRMLAAGGAPVPNPVAFSAPFRYATATMAPPDRESASLRLTNVSHRHRV